MYVFKDGFKYIGAHFENGVCVAAFKTNTKQDAVTFQTKKEAYSFREKFSVYLNWTLVQA